jgi:excisionase family DNA binding protein
MRTTPERDGVREVSVREVMDIRMASDYLGISPDTLYKYASDGFVPAFKLGNRWRFKRSRLDGWMDQQSSEGALPRKVETRLDVTQPRKPQSVAPRQKRAIAAAR